MHDKIVINWKVDKNTSLNEIFQNLPIKFAYLYKDPEVWGGFVSGTPLFKCRDFFNEVWFKENYPQINVDIVYRFDANKLPVDLKEEKSFFLLIDFNKLSLNLFKESLNVFNKYEEEMGFVPTKIIAEDDKQIIVKCSRKDWATNPTILSILTWCLRCMFYTPLTKGLLPWEVVKELGSDVCKTDYSFVNYKNVDKIFWGVNRINKYVPEFDLTNLNFYHLHETSGFMMYLNMMTTSPDYDNLSRLFHEIAFGCEEKKVAA